MNSFNNSRVLVKWSCLVQVTLLSPTHPGTKVACFTVCHRIASQRNKIHNGHLQSILAILWNICTTGNPGELFFNMNDTAHCPVSWDFTVYSIF